MTFQFLRCKWCCESCWAGRVPANKRETNRLAANSQDMALFRLSATSPSFLMHADVQDGIMLLLDCLGFSFLCWHERTATHGCSYLCWDERTATHGCSHRCWAERSANSWLFHCSAGEGTTARPHTLKTGLSSTHTQGYFKDWLFSRVYTLPPFVD
jgi:hypothetical protein